MRDWLRRLVCKWLHGAHRWPDGMHRYRYKCMRCKREWAEADLP